MSAFRPVLLVPHYEHVNQFTGYLPALLASGTPLIVVDDGSGEATVRQLEALADAEGFSLVRRGDNGGKGEAMITGFLAAREQGYSHAFQVDADGQHDPEDIPRFLAAAEARPDTLVCGAPVFGDDAPRVRVWGRKLTDLVVALETWSTGVRDALCGFRVYPLEKTLAVIDGHRPGARMDFDADLLVALRWAGMPLHFLPTQVRYPEQGVSHFRYVADNARMVGLHVKLILTMLLRSPILLADRIGGRFGAVTAEEP
ncbi:MAG: glycosyltransferase family 2 protein [Xanthomonadales bacterium]|jgi:glycosyltransferase involved in cell wall biosynthesis|nr:glycosyltransferase family 2 protein [Xanthomonadales bacterium]